MIQWRKQHYEIHIVRTGAVVTVLLHFVISNAQYAKGVEEVPYEHIDFVSTINQDDCFICGNQHNPLTAPHWGENNIAILDLNIFELLRLEINRYGDHSESITTEAGFMQMYGMETENGWVYANVCPDRGYANVDIPALRTASTGILSRTTYAKPVLILSTQNALVMILLRSWQWSTIWKNRPYIDYQHNGIRSRQLLC